MTAEKHEYTDILWETEQLRWRLQGRLLIGIPGIRHHKEHIHKLYNVLVRLVVINVHPHLEDVPSGVLNDERLARILASEDLYELCEQLDEDQLTSTLIDRYNEGLPKMAQLVHAS